MRVYATLSQSFRFDDSALQYLIFIIYSCRPVRRRAGVHTHTHNRVAVICCFWVNSYRSTTSGPRAHRYFSCCCCWYRNVFLYASRNTIHRNEEKNAGTVDTTSWPHVLYYTLALKSRAWKNEIALLMSHHHHHRRYYGAGIRISHNHRRKKKAQQQPCTYKPTHKQSKCNRRRRKNASRRRKEKFSFIIFSSDFFFYSLHFTFRLARVFSLTFMLFAAATMGWRWWCCRCPPLSLTLSTHLMLHILLRETYLCLVRAIMRWSSVLHNFIFIFLHFPLFSACLPSHINTFLFA